MKKRSPAKRLLLVLGSAAVLFLLGIAVLVLSGLPEHLGKADVALVLGNKVELDGTPSARLRARLDRTIVFYQAGYFPSIIASGGMGKEGYDEAVVMRDYLVAHGIASEHVIVDSAGTTTMASARNTLQIVRQRNLKSVFVVSQYFHIPRARLALRRFGIAEVYSAPAHFFEMRDFFSVPREAVGYLSYLLRSYDAPAAPGA